MRLDEMYRRLELYRRAESAILTAQSYEIDGMRLTRADLGMVQDMINKLEGAILKAENPRSRMRVIIPADGMRVHRP